MTKKSKSKKQNDNNHDLLLSRRREWRLDMPLSVLVKGKLPNGKNFNEKTTIENISSGGAYLSLDAGITIDTELTLLIEVPSKLTEGKKIKLSLSGSTVRMEKIEEETPKKKTYVAVRFDKRYEFLD